MAAFARPIGPTAPSPAAPAGLEPSHARNLPRGGCNFRTGDTGAQPLQCGCKRFWLDVPGDDAAAPVCVCSHHACFHDNAEAGHHGGGRPETTPPALRASFSALGSDQRAPVYLQLASSNGEVRYQLMAGANPVSLHGLDHGRKTGIFITTPKERSQATHPDRPSSVVARFEQQAAQGGALPAADVHADAAVGRFSSPLFRTATSQPTGALLGQPSQARAGAAQGEAASGNYMRPPSAGAGLGLTWQSRALEVQQFDQSPTPTVPDDSAEMARLLSILPRTEALPSTAAQSFQQRDGPARDFANQTWNPTEPTLPLTIPLNVQAPPGYTDILRSATEIHTPSSKATPDLTEIQAYLREAQSLAEVISQRVTPSRNGEKSDDVASQVMPAPTHAHTVDAPDPNPALSVDVVGALRKLPDVLRQLIPQFDQLLGHLNTYPTISTSHQALIQRVEALQNMSFDHVTPDEFVSRYEHLDARLLEIEGKVKDHEDYHTALDEDQSSIQGARNRQSRAMPADATASFGSGSSNHSATSSALLQAAVDRLETETKLKDVEERLEVLEATALPSTARPWEIEVVLLPWGRPLKGIWTSMDEAEALTQPSAQTGEEWNQSRAVRSATQSFSSAQVGWSSQAIHDWADASDEWLSPRACGPTGMVHKRLRSRGFVKKVSLTGCGATHVHATISAAFKPLLDRLEELNPELEELGVYEVGRTFDPGDHHPMTNFLGLREPIIPLRKVHKSSRLRFLAASELATSALWDAQFLSSGIMMRAPGGQKRLFVTTRAAYHQRMDGDQDGWTWQKLRELPRVTGDDAQSSGIGGHVGEADAKEPCWAYNENLDPPPSVHSSFGSSHSGRSTRSVEARQRGHAEDDAIMDDPFFTVIHDSNRILVVPGSSTPPSGRHQRTTSVPLAVGMMDHTRPGSAAQSLGHQRLLPKRRVISFEQIEPGRRGDQFAASRGQDSAVASVTDLDDQQLASPSQTHRTKRRRFTRTQSADAISDTTDQQFLSRSGLSSVGLTRNPSESMTGRHGHRMQQTSADKWRQATPRRSREPPSPFVGGLALSAAASEAAGPSTGSAGGNAARYAAWEAGAGNGVEPLLAKDGPVAAYATPYSAGEGIAGYGGDTQADTESLNQRYIRHYDEEQADDGSNDDDEEEEEDDDDDDDDDGWEGVEEQQATAAARTTRPVRIDRVYDVDGSPSDEDGGRDDNRLGGEEVREEDESDEDEL